MIQESFRAFVLGIAALALASCGGETPAPEHAAETTAAGEFTAPASQILITVESFAGRRVVPFGGQIGMPRISELVAAGTTYDDAVSTTTLARPSLVSILTGVSPDRSGVRDNIHDALPAGLPTLAEGAKAAGFETAAFVSTPFASYSSGLQRGFELFDGPEALVVGPAQHDPPVVAADAVAGHFKEWLASRRSTKPFFVWIHLADLNGVSVPLQLTKVQTGDKASDFPAYDAKLAGIDAALGTILDALRSGPSSAKPVALTLAGTHGTYLGEDDRYGDAFWLADETLHVPLVRVADLADRSTTPRHEARPTWLPDVAATLAKAMSVNLATTSDGVPLDVAPQTDRVRFAWGYAPDDQLGWPPQLAMRNGAKFDLVDAKTGARPALPRVRQLPDSARAEVAKAGLKLGTPSAERPLAKADAWLKDLQLVRRYLAGDRPGLAGERSRQLIKVAPDALASLVTRAFFFSSEPRKEGPALRDKLLARFPERSEALHWAAHIELVEKRYEQAAALLEAAMAVGPVEPEMYYDLACVRSIQGNQADALTALDRALTAGYRNWDWIDTDPDLSAVRADPGFPALLRAHGR